MSATPPINRKTLTCYGMLAMPLAFAGMPLYVHAPDYYATQQGVSLGAIGVALLILRIMDAIMDPIIGQLSDRFSASRRSIILSAALLLVITFAALFQPVGESSLLWFAVTMLLATLAFSLLSINLNTLGGLWSREPEEQTRITTGREAFGLVGLLLAVLLPGALSQIMPASHAFAWVGGLLAILTFLSVILIYRWFQSYEPAQTSTTATRPHYWQTLTGLSGETRRFFAIYGLSMLASAMPAVLVLFFIRDRLDAEELTGLFLLLYFLAGAAAMPLWRKLREHLGIYRSWTLSMILAVGAFIWAYFLHAGDLWQFGLICVASGIAFGADLALPPAILANHIHQQQHQQSASLQFGFFAFLAKTAMAIGSALSFALLDSVGFEAGAENGEQALQMLSLTYAAIPCAIKLLAALWLWRSFPAEPVTLTGGSHALTSNPPNDRSSFYA